MVADAQHYSNKGVGALEKIMRSRSSVSLVSDDPANTENPYEDGASVHVSTQAGAERTAAAPRDPPRDP